MRLKPAAPGRRSHRETTACPAARRTGSAATAARRCGSRRARSGCRATPRPTALRPASGRSRPARHSPRPPPEASRTARRRAPPRVGMHRPPTVPSTWPRPTASQGPSGMSVTPTRARSAANSSSGGAHIRTSAPSPRSWSASAASGSMSPREPHDDGKTRMAWTSGSVGACRAADTGAGQGRPARVSSLLCGRTAKETPRTTLPVAASASRCRARNAPNTGSRHAARGPAHRDGGPVTLATHEGSPPTPAARDRLARTSARPARPPIRARWR